MDECETERHWLYAYLLTYLITVLTTVTFMGGDETNMYTMYKGDEEMDSKYLQALWLECIMVHHYQLMTFLRVNGLMHITCTVSHVLSMHPVHFIIPAFINAGTNPEQYICPGSVCDCIPKYVWSSNYNSLQFFEVGVEFVCKIMRLG